MSVNNNSVYATVKKYIDNNTYSLDCIKQALNLMFDRIVYKFVYAIVDFEGLKLILNANKNTKCYIFQINENMFAIPNIEENGQYYSVNLKKPNGILDYYTINLMSNELLNVCTYFGVKVSFMLLKYCEDAKINSVDNCNIHVNVMKNKFNFKRFKYLLDKLKEKEVNKWYSENVFDSDEEYKEEYDEELDEIYIHHIQLDTALDMPFSEYLEYFSEAAKFDIF